MAGICEICAFPLLAMRDSEIAAYLATLAREGEGAWVLTLNLEMVSRDLRDPEYSRLCRQADLCLADGMPLVWASYLRRRRNRIPGRCPGVDLARELLTSVDPRRIAIIGGVDPRAALAKVIPNQAREVFVFDGFVSDEDSAVDALAAQLLARDVTLIFCALGVPKQDRMALKLRQRVPRAVILGVGGTFEMIAGIVKRCPAWMQKIGFEWLYRLTRDPRRLWRRYLVEYWGGLLAVLRDARAPMPVKRAPAPVYSPDVERRKRKRAS
jgi:N-acetylglucosaminyldiphosphoundecaprenol N-acetyl-beta-D-mannosaminyltransferase